MRRERANPDQVALIQRRSETVWKKMTLSQKTVDFTARHQFSVIAGCWALGIAGAFGTIMRNPCVRMRMIGDKRETDKLMVLQDIKVCHKRYGAFDRRNDGEAHNKSILDRASEDVVAGDHDWSCYCGRGSNTDEDVSTGLGGRWTSRDERGSLLAGEGGG